MLVQFNLLPDVKLEYARQQKTKRLVYGATILASLVAITIFVISFVSVSLLQKKLLDNAGKDITTYSNKIKSIPNLQKILTVQNQLNSLPGLHDKKHYQSRLFTYLPQVTPTNISIDSVVIDNTANTIELDGSSDTVETINKFVDTIKFTSYVVGSNQSTKKLAFSNVVLSNIGRNDKNATYTVKASFDPSIFTGTKPISLVVPQETTTRSVLDAPNAKTPLFNAQTQGGQ
jgi:Tfp pilus assembly protein PilN